MSGVALVVAATVLPSDTQLVALFGGLVLLGLSLLIFLRPGMSEVPTDPVPDAGTVRKLKREGDRRGALSLVPVELWEWFMCGSALLPAVVGAFTLAASSFGKSIGVGALGSAALLIGGLGLRGGYNLADRVSYLLGALAVGAFVSSAVLRPFI